MAWKLYEMEVYGLHNLNVIPSPFSRLSLIQKLVIKSDFYYYIFNSTIIVVYDTLSTFLIENKIKLIFKHSGIF